MSDYWNEDDERGESNPMKTLREMHDADTALIREMREELQAIRKERQTDKLSKVVESRELDPSVLGLAEKAGYELTEAGLDSFIKDFGNVVAKKTKEEPAPSGEEQTPADVVRTVLAAEEQEELAAMSAASQGAQPASGLAATEAAITSADSPEAVMALLQTLTRKSA